MATKALSRHQHQVLHSCWPTDCCLCRAEGRIHALENEIANLKAQLMLKDMGVPDSFGPADDATCSFEPRDEL